MGKTFKNSIAVSGPKSLLKAFAEELDNSGYQASSTIHEDTTHLITYTNGTYGFHNHSGCALNIRFSIPLEWHQALSSAKEEATPEYIRITSWPINNKAWYTGKTGEIFKVLGVKDFGAYVVKDENHWVMFDCCKPATEQEFKEWQNRPKYQAGQFVKFERGLLYIEEVADGGILYTYSQQTPTGVPGKLHDINTFYKNSVVYNEGVVVSDAEALEMLKTYWEGQGVKVGARVSYGKNDTYTHTVHHFDLVKNAPASDWAFIPGAVVKPGTSQFAIYLETGRYYVTPSTDNFKIGPKELKISGYKVEKQHATTQSLVKVGCHIFTKDSIKVIKSILTSEMYANDGVCKFRHEGRDISVTIDQLDEILNLIK